jgi:site-specific DNA-cytosine methylase
MSIRMCDLFAGIGGIRLGFVGAFEEIGYTVFYKVLNSKDFGVP